MKLGFILFVLILVLVSLILIFYRTISHFFEKITFHHKAARTVYQIAKNNDYYLLNKVAIPIEGKVIHFDHILFGDKYIFCIVSRYYPVGISGKFDDSSWIQYQRSEKIKIIKNPMKLNQERVNYFSSAISSSKDLFVGIVLTNKSCLLEENIEGANDHNLIVPIQNIVKTIKRYEKNVLVSPIEPDSLKLLVQDIYQKCIDEKKK